ncbi:MAG TPA: alpha/beta hydrolase [Phototrophicaceae bacterium]|nr:alpha/beta hydrolase [Phototrophicaceae bacterium]
MPTIETARGVIWYADHRKKAAAVPPLVLVHGAGGSHLDWPGELRRLPEAGVIVPDLPGHGKSPGAARHSINEYAADVVALLDALKIQRAIIAGHSMGGAIALTLALQHSARVLGLILIGTGAKLGVHPDVLNVQADKDKAVEMIMDGYWGTAAEYDDYRRLSRDWLLTVDAEVLYRDYAACNAFDVRSQLDQIQTPALIIGATDDRMTPLKYSAYLHEQLPNSQLVTINGANHMLALQQPGAVAEAVKSWLAAQRW